LPNYSMEKIKEIILKLFKLEGIAENLTNYVETRLELFKLEIRTDFAKAIAKALALFFLGLLAFLFLLFVSLGVAYLINELFRSSYIGFFSVGMLYGLLFLLLYTNRKSFSTTLETQLLKPHKDKLVD
jgi:uncharacterized membrane protein YqjE